MTTPHPLKPVRDLLTPEGAWTQLTMARLPNGAETFAAHPEACSFCLSGAIRRVYPNPKSDERNDTFGLLHRHLQSIPGWNDRPDRTQAQVLSMLDRIMRYTIEPSYEPRGEGNGWAKCEPALATARLIYDNDTNMLVESFETDHEARSWIIDHAPST